LHSETKQENRYSFGKILHSRDLQLHFDLLQTRFRRSLPRISVEWVENVAENREHYSTIALKFYVKFLWIFYGPESQVLGFHSLTSCWFVLYDSNFDLLCCPYVFILKCLFFLLKWWTGETTSEIVNFISHVFDILEHFHYLSHFRPLKPSPKVTHCEYTWIYLSKSSIWQNGSHDISADYSKIFTWICWVLSYGFPKLSWFKIFQSWIFFGTKFNSQ